MPIRLIHFTLNTGVMTMSNVKDVLVPDVGGEEVEIIEVCVAVGDSVEAEDALITVETDKASMDIPAPFAGTVSEILVNVGDKVSQDALIVKIAEAAASAESETVAEAPAPSPAPRLRAAAPRVNRSKISSRSDGATPGPSSSTAISIALPVEMMVTWVAPSPYFSAFLNKLSST